MSGKNERKNRCDGDATRAALVEAAGRLQPASRYAERFASAEAVNHFVARLRADQGIVAHRQITETQGRQIADWLSKPAAQPVR